MRLEASRRKVPRGIGNDIAAPSGVRDSDGEEANEILTCSFARFRLEYVSPSEEVSD
jgi:hypothetical protein